MARVFIAVGSNIDPEQNVERAMAQLCRDVRLVAISTFYRTEPIGRRGAPQFVNGMIEAETDRSPEGLKCDVLRRIEAELGRRRTADKNADRTIDLDLVLYGDLALCTPEMVVPDPALFERAFLARTLFELAPDLRIPGSTITVRRLAQMLSAHAMQPLSDLTAALRRNLANE